MNEDLRELVRIQINEVQLHFYANFIDAFFVILSQRQRVKGKVCQEFPARVRTDVSVFVTSQEKKSSLSPESPGGHVPQASAPIFKTAFFSCQTQTQIRKRLACEAPCFEIGATSLFLNRLPTFLVSSYSLDFIIDVLSTFLQSFTPVSKGQLTRC